MSSKVIKNDVAVLGASTTPSHAYERAERLLASRVRIVTVYGDLRLNAKTTPALAYLVQPEGERCLCCGATAKFKEFDQ